MLFNNNHGKRLVFHWISLSASYIVTKKHFSESFSDFKSLNKPHDIVENLCVPAHCPTTEILEKEEAAGTFPSTECEFRHLASNDGKMLMSRRVQVYHQNLFKHERTAAVERT
ncbi:hypothetical protein MKW98_002501 [Papaver atlanticum]|uniref:Uncharacterized protein n=1 Tax=Papaver atlanticum TaxID=357466 RepID=A0AAD4XCE1_9MAGN|nr:hypothetical protein MKW98_002501 [Papaver atlanticum]